MARDVSTIIDSLNFFVESRNVGNIINVVTTATGGANSGDLVNTDQLGGMFFITVASITVNSATLGLSILAKDVSASTYFPYARVSLDSLTASSSLQYMALFYVGAASTPGASGVGIAGSINGNVVNFGLPLPGTFQVVSSLTLGAVTATNSQTMSYKVDYAKVM
jgi:hypothetical protein